jgi:hypothetical protein
LKSSHAIMPHEIGSVKAVGVVWVRIAGVCAGVGCQKGRWQARFTNEKGR